jgi:hypothetical protein
MRPPRRIFTVFVLTLVGACAARKPAAQSAPPSTTAQAQEAGIDTQALLAVELEPQKTHPVVATDKSFKATLEASSAPQVVAGEGYQQITAPLGEHALVCIVYPGAKDAGELLRVMVENTLTKAAPNHQWVDVRGDQEKGWGYVAARAHYLVDGPKGKLLGDFKIATSVREETTVVCLLDAPGLYGTFERTLRGFLGSLAVKKQVKPKPAEASITRGQIPGRMVNIDRTYHLNKGKTKVALKFSTMLAINPEGKLAISDGASAEVYAKGALESGQYASLSDGHALYNIALARENQTYKVSGTMQDKPVASEFSADTVLLDRERSTAEICKVRNGKLPQVALADYNPESDPLRPSTTVFEKNGTPDGDVRLTTPGAANTQMFMRLDKQCEIAGGVVKVGTISVELERLWQQKGKS